MWLSCFAVGFRLEGNLIKVSAPFGLEDLANMQVRPNKKAMSKSNYDSMSSHFNNRWPGVEIEN